MSANLTLRVVDDLNGEVFGDQAVTGIATAGGPITLVNTARGQDATGTPLATLDSDSFVATAGNLIVVSVRAGVGAATITVTDTAGNTYTQIDTATGNAAAAYTSFYAKNITGHATNVITAHFSVNASYDSIVAAQYSGLNTSAPLDAHRIDVFDVATINPVTGTFTTTTADEVLVVTTIQNGDGTGVSQGTGYTAQVFSAGPPGQQMLQDKIVSSTQTNVTADANSSASLSWILAVMTFKKA